MLLYIKLIILDILVLSFLQKISYFFSNNITVKNYHCFYSYDFFFFDFDFIECFTTTFLRAHSWLNWVDEDDDEDEVGLKEKPEDTRYIKKITSK